MNQLLQQAIEYATKKHAGQQYDGEPYTKHLRWVASVAERFGSTDPEILATCWLHDTVEDTDATVDEIRVHFGDRVCNLVSLLTDQPGRNRRERHEKTYGGIKASADATFVKLCDRIANVEASVALKDKPSFLSMYQKEWEDFKRLLRTPGTHDNMWQHLATLLNRAL